MKPIVSIIIPVYNGEKFIEACIRSVMAQTIRELQIIIVDDGSRDKTLSILKGLASEDERIEIIHKSNAGVSSARNIGIQAVQTDWVVFVDADDTIMPDYCISLLEAVRCLHADVVIASQKVKGKENRYLLNEKEKLVQACLSYDESSYVYNVDAPWGKIFNYRVITENGIYFPEELTRSEDAYFCMNFYECAHKIGVLNYFGYQHTEREGSICRSFTSNAPDILENVLSINYRWVMKHHPGEKDFLNALWYRVLPGIIECENTFLLHPQFAGAVGAEYQKMLRQTMIQQAIHNLKLSNVTKKQYKLRLMFYKLKLGRVFIMLKRYK